MAYCEGRTFALAPTTTAPTQVIIIVHDDDDDSDDAGESVFEVCVWLSQGNYPAFRKG